MSDPAIVAVAAQAIDEIAEMPDNWDEQDSRLLALVVLEAVEPLIRAATLEKAVQLVERDGGPIVTRSRIAAAIRALKNQP